MSDGNTVQQIFTFSCKLETSPAAVAIANGAEFVELGFELLSYLEDFRATDVFGVAAEEGHYVEVFANFITFEQFGFDFFATEAAKRTLASANNYYGGDSGRGLTNPADKQ